MPQRKQQEQAPKTKREMDPPQIIKFESSRKRKFQVIESS